MDRLNNNYFAQDELEFKLVVMENRQIIFSIYCEPPMQWHNDVINILTSKMYL